MKLTGCAEHMSITYARDLHPDLYKGLHATSARLVQKMVAGTGSGNRALRVKLTKMLNIPGVAHKNSNKLTPKWEGPYRVKRVTRPGAVRLETEDGTPVSNSWNIEHLRKFYP